MNSYDCLVLLRNGDWMIHATIQTSSRRRAMRWFREKVKTKRPMMVRPSNRLLSRGMAW